jgi:hypothetical protein
MKWPFDICVHSYILLTLCIEIQIQRLFVEFKGEVAAARGCPRREETDAAALEIEGSERDVTASVTCDVSFAKTKTRSGEHASRGSFTCTGSESYSMSKTLPGEQAPTGSVPGRELSHGRQGSFQRRSAAENYSVLSKSDSMDKEIQADMERSSMIQPHSTQPGSTVLRDHDAISPTVAKSPETLKSDRTSDAATVGDQTGLCDLSARETASREHSALLEQLDSDAKRSDVIQSSHRTCTGEKYACPRERILEDGGVCGDLSRSITAYHDGNADSSLSRRNAEDGNAQNHDLRSATQTGDLAAQASPAEESTKQGAICSRGNPGMTSDNPIQAKTIDCLGTGEARDAANAGRNCQDES